MKKQEIYASLLAAVLSEWTHDRWCEKNKQMRIFLQHAIERQGEVLRSEMVWHFAR